jgi:hypothetical protein
LIGLAKELSQKVEPIRKGSYGYSYRKIRGSNEWSNALAKKCGLRWGGNYRRRKDEMHFEVILPRPKAEALARRLSQAR